MKVTPKIKRSGGNSVSLSTTEPFHAEKEYAFLDEHQTIDVPDSLGEYLIVKGLYLPEGIGAKKGAKPSVDLTPAIPDDGVIGGTSADDEETDEAAAERAALAAEYEAIFKKPPHHSMSTDNLRKKIEAAKAGGNKQ